MLKTLGAPTSLRQAMTFFADKDFAFQFFVQLRWPNGVRCMACESERLSLIKTRRIWQCLECGKQFGPKLGTIFEDSALGLEKWLPAMWMLANAKNGISSCELARALGVTQKTAWFMLGRIRKAMADNGGDPFGGAVEIDETYIGGLAKFMHKGRGSKHKRVIKGSTGMVGKTAIMGILRRGRGKKGVSQIRASVVHSIRKGAMTAKVKANVVAGSKVYTDALMSYNGLKADYEHFVIDHAKQYVRDRVIHTNGLENFWSLLKRAIKGTYVSVDPFHLFRYLDEQVFRFNHRKSTDGERFLHVARSIIGVRLDWRDLTGKDLNPATT